MVRRSFRIGLWIGLLLGVTLALRRTVQLRRSAERPEISTEPWPPVRFEEHLRADEFRRNEPAPEPLRSGPFPAAPRSESAPEAAAAARRHGDEHPPLEEAVAEEIRLDAALEPSGAVAIEEGGGAVEEPAAVEDDDWSVPEIEEPPPERPARPAKKAAGAGRATAKKAARPKKPAMAWVEPDEGACPNSHPIKAKLSSGIFHLPGMFAYDRTKADRCYASAEDAESDGLHRAKR